MLHSEFEPYGKPGAQEDLKASHHRVQGNKKPGSSWSQVTSPSTSAVLPEALHVRPAPSDSTTGNSHPRQKSSTESLVFVFPHSRSNRSANIRELLTGDLAHWEKLVLASDARAGWAWGEAH